MAEREGLRSDNGERRLVRCRFVIKNVLTNIMRNYMQVYQVPPITIFNSIKAEKTFCGRLSRLEFLQLDSMRDHGLEKLDLHFMYKIARYPKFAMIIVEKPSQNWESIPRPDENSIADNIMRIWICKTIIERNPNLTLSENDFQEIFARFVDIAKRADEHLKRTENSFVKQIERRKHFSIGYCEGEIENEPSSLTEVFEIKLETGISTYVYLNQAMESRKNQIRNTRCKEEILEARLVICGLENKEKNINLNNILCQKLKTHYIECRKGMVMGSVVLVTIKDELFMVDRLLKVELERFLLVLFKETDMKCSSIQKTWLILELEEFSCKEEYEISEDAEYFNERNTGISSKSEDKFYKKKESFAIYANAAFDCFSSDKTMDHIKKFIELILKRSNSRFDNFDIEMIDEKQGKTKQSNISYPSLTHSPASSLLKNRKLEKEDEVADTYKCGIVSFFECFVAAGMCVEDIGAIKFNDYRERIQFPFGLDCMIDRRLEIKLCLRHKHKATTLGIIEDRRHEFDTNCMVDMRLDEEHLTEYKQILKITKLHEKEDLERYVKKSLYESIQKGKDLYIRWLLSNFDFLNYEKVFKDAVHCKKESVIKCIAWHIVKRFISEFKTNFMIRQATVWPGFICSCKRKDVKQMCSTDFVIVIETGEIVNNLPKIFEGFIIKQYLLNRENKETKELASKISSLWDNEGCCENIFVSGEIAKQLFSNHSNLSLVCSSVVKSRGSPENHNIYTLKCIQLHCAVKGIIPIIESHFPSVVCKYQTDILEGRPCFAGQLRIGEVIGTLDNTNQPKSRGTLGGFVKHLGHECFMTCAHVVIDLKNLLSGLDVDTENNGITVFNFPPTNPPSIIGKCGKVMRRIFEHSQHDKTSIDVALVELHESSVNEQDLFINDAGLRSPRTELGLNDSVNLNENCLDFESVRSMQPHVMCPGGFKQERLLLKEWNRVEYNEIQFPVSNISTPQGSAVPLMISTPAHMQLNTGSITGHRVFQMYNQLLLKNLPLNLGDSGTCVYVIGNSLNQKGCIGMAIAFMTNVGTIVTPMTEILKKIRH